MNSDFRTGNRHGLNPERSDDISLDNGGTAMSAHWCGDMTPLAVGGVVHMTTTSPNGYPTKLLDLGYTPADGAITIP